MKTDELIEALGTTVERVEARAFRNGFIIALLIGVAAAIFAMHAVLGMSARAMREVPLEITVVTAVFVIGVIGAGSSYLLKAAYPAMTVRGPAVLIALLLAGFLCAGLAGLLAVHPTAWRGMIFGPPWTVCLACIPLFAMGPFLALIWTLRRGAPTQLRATGAVAGLIAGAIGAGACALHMPGPSLPFIGLWYAVPILICALLGAWLGPRLLRW